MDITCRACAVTVAETDDDQQTRHRCAITGEYVDHDPANCDPGNLVALCAPCHLRYDARHHANNAMMTRMGRARRAGQITLDF